MKIAQIAPIIERVPPKKYGGTERVVYELTEELVRRGHEVTLFASGDSITSAKLVSVYPRGLREAKFDELYAANHLSMLNIGMAYQEYEKFDVIHDHNWPLSLPTANIVPKPVIMTNHGPFFGNVRRLFADLRKPYVVSISKAQGAMAPNINHIGTVYNGLTMDHYPFSKDHDGYLLWVGRFDMEKAPHLAIEVAQYLDMPLILAGKVEPIHQNYFNEYIAPRLSDSGQIRWVGEVDEEERNRLMSRAAAFLHPLTWPEPFGLVMIEAMACGTPVIAMNMGSVPEIVVQGKTGYVVNSTDEMIESVLNISAINREDCRAHALENFNAKKMVNGYENVYREAIKRSAVRTMKMSPGRARLRR